MSDEIKKRKSVSLAAFFYISFPIYCLITIILQTLNNQAIISTSKILFAVVFIVLPIILLFLPSVLHSSKKDFGECVKTALIFSLIYATLAAAAEFGIRAYFTSFTAAKWSSFPENRYLMIDDLEKNYNIVGMSTNEVENLLGTAAQHDSIMGQDALIYGVDKEFFADKYYAIIYDDNGIVTETQVGRTLESL